MTSFQMGFEPVIKSLFSPKQNRERGRTGARGTDKEGERRKRVKLYLQSPLILKIWHMLLLLLPLLPINYSLDRCFFSLCFHFQIESNRIELNWIECSFFSSVVFFFLKWLNRILIKILLSVSSKYIVCFFILHHLCVLILFPFPPKEEKKIMCRLLCVKLCDHSSLIIVFFSSEKQQKITKIHVRMHAHRSLIRSSAIDTYYCNI